jgi:hypothetical protein
MVPENKQNRIYKLINFIGLQNIRHPSQHTVGNAHKTSGNCEQDSSTGPVFWSILIQYTNYT